jgi:GalNAc-alpha-(1->4)-GalNAc-alpha-(1->3)-diNAcBac-PP-undecaprenol alpha-1,4-N-acetyl-D-galactosaminyltransferase
VRIAVVIFSLRPGGAERVASTLVNGWARAGDDIIVVSFEAPASDFYRIEPSVRRVALEDGARSKSWRDYVGNNLRRVRLLRDLIRSLETDLVLSLGDKTNVLTLLATIGCGVPVIVAEHNDPRRHSIGAAATALRRVLYPRACRVVVLTPGIASWAKGVVGLASVRVIPNPLDTQFTKEHATAKKTQNPTIVAMGRLVPQKGFDLLLKAFAHCLPEHSGWRLHIYGEGTEREKLLTIADSLGISSKVDFNPPTKEPERVLRESHLFVLSSRYEGFPMALLEAMACSLPVISFDCQSGPSEMISNGVNGILVPPGDVSALASAMNRLMGDEQTRRSLSSRAAEVAERYGFPQVNAMWRELFAEVDS